MDEVQIVTLAPEEWRAYRQLRLDSLSTDPQAFGANYTDMLQRPDAYWRSRLADARAGEKSWMVFAREGDRLVGMIGAFATGNPDVVEIISVYVTPEKRRQGIGNLLMDAILAEIAKKGSFVKAVLGVNSAQASAVALYRRYGFEVVREETVTRSDGEVRRGYFMEKSLVHP